MAFQIDRSLHWTDHYVEHGFAVLRGVVGSDFTAPALERVRKLIKNHLPLNQWTPENAPTRVPGSEQDPLLTQVYDQPGIQEMMRAMFHPVDAWSGERAFLLFINPFDASAKPALSPEGHLDFVQTPIPIFGSGFMFQVSLVKSEPFSGNLTIYPGTHKHVQRALVENPDYHYPTSQQIKRHMTGDPYEFVAEPGDVCLFHHLVAHSGNPSHAPGKSPRVTLHCQATCRNWLHEVDPQAQGLSPWERSLAFTGGPYRVKENELEKILRYKREHAQQRQGT